MLAETGPMLAETGRLGSHSISFSDRLMCCTRSIDGHLFRDGSQLPNVHCKLSVRALSRNWLGHGLPMAK